MGVADVIIVGAEMKDSLYDGYGSARRKLSVKQEGNLKMAPKAKPKVDDEVEYKVMDCFSSISDRVEEELNSLAKDGWRVITAIQDGRRLILERDL
jgi:hypothetical protein